MNESVTFCVLGDPARSYVDPKRTSKDFLHRLTEMMAAEHPDFVLVLGDCVAGNGHDPRAWERFFDFMSPIRNDPTIKLYAIPGDRDIVGGAYSGIEHWQKHWDLPGNKLYYSFTQGPVYVGGLLQSPRLEERGLVGPLWTALVSLHSAG